MKINKNTKGYIINGNHIDHVTINVRGYNPSTVAGIAVINDDGLLETKYNSEWFTDILRLACLTGDVVGIKEDGVISYYIVEYNCSLTKISEDEAYSHLVICQPDRDYIRALDGGKKILYEEYIKSLINK